MVRQRDLRELPRHHMVAAMRTFFAVCLLACLLGADGDEEKSKRGKLDAEASAKLLTAIAGLVILGMGLITLIWMGARFTRRYMGLHESPPLAGGSPKDPDDWAKKPMIDNDDQASFDDT